MTIHDAIAVSGLAALVLVIAAIWWAARLGGKAREGELERADRRADEAGERADDAEARARYVREAERIRREGEDRAAAVDRDGVDLDRLRRLLRGDAEDPPAT